MAVRIMTGDCRARMRELPDASVNCCVTSPPYFGLRDYGVEGQMGLEPTPDEFVVGMVEVFREVRRVLRDDGTLWLNIGDSYASFRDGKATPDTTRGDSEGTLVPKGAARNRMAATFRGSGVKHKDLVGIPWMLAFALRADGWYLRQDIIWSKPNPMPESVRDRCTKAHEYLFLLSKRPRYYFDAAAISEPITCDRQRGSGPMVNEGTGRNDAATGTLGDYRRSSGNKQRKSRKEHGGNPDHPGGQSFGVPWEGSKRNKRSVWDVSPQPFAEAHFATYPPALIEPAIQAGCPVGGLVLDPFFGAGTTGLVADRLGRDCIGCELNGEYVEIAVNRLRRDGGMFMEIARD